MHQIISCLVRKCASAHDMVNLNCIMSKIVRKCKKKVFLTLNFNNILLYVRSNIKHKLKVHNYINVAYT